MPSMRYGSLDKPPKPPKDSIKIKAKKRTRPRQFPDRAGGQPVPPDR